jgi:hypothetical protein
MQRPNRRRITMIPTNIAAAINSANSQRAQPVRGQETISRGDLRRVKSGPIERLVLVLLVDSTSETSQITLVHSYPEFATEFDIIVDPVLSGVSYPIVVETDLRGVISTAELGEYLTTLPENLILACFEELSEFVEDAESFIGPSLLGPLDARWDFKVIEGETIREISAPAINSLDGKKTGWELNFDEIFSALLLPVDDAREMALAVYELWLRRGDSLVVTPDHIVLFDERGLLGRELWVAALKEVGACFYDSVMVGFVEQARSAFNRTYESPAESIGISELRELQNA